MQLGIWPAALGFGLRFEIQYCPPPLSNSWILSIMGLYIALNRTPNIDCYWLLLGGGSTHGLEFRV